MEYQARIIQQKFIHFKRFTVSQNIFENEKREPQRKKMFLAEVLFLKFIKEAMSETTELFFVLSVY